MLENKKYQITWIELLPKDCIQCIRKWISKRDYDDVLKELKSQTLHDLIWIAQCSQMEFHGIEGKHLQNIRYQPFIVSYRNDVPWLPSIKNIIEFLDLHFRDSHSIHSIPYSQVMQAFLLNEKYNTNKSIIFEKLWLFLNSELKILHDTIKNIKHRYLENIALPVEFVNRVLPTQHRHQDSPFVWTDTKDGFSRYISEDASIASYRETLYRLCRKIIYHCGYIKSIRENVYNIIKEIYRVDY